MSGKYIFAVPSAARLQIISSIYLLTNYTDLSSFSGIVSIHPSLEMQSRE